MTVGRLPLAGMKSIQPLIATFELTVNGLRIGTSRLRSLAVVSFSSGAALSVFAFAHPYFPGDLALARVVQSLSEIRHLMWFISWLGADWVPYLYVIATGLTFHVLRHHRWAVIIWVGVGGSALLNRGLKLTIARQRPGGDLIEILIHYPNESFPSGHVVLFMTYFGFLAYLAANTTLPRAVRTTVIAGTVVLILLVGPSRVYVGAHWPSDVIGGYLFGAGWLAVMVLLNRRMQPS